MKFFSDRRKKRSIARRSTVRGTRGRGVRVERLEDRLLLATVTFNNPSSNGGDGTWTLQSREAINVAVGPAYLYYGLNPFTAFPGYSQGDALYVQVDYFDEGTGTVRVQYDSTRENFDPTDFHTRSTRIDTQQFVTSHHYLDSTQFANGTNGHDFRVAAFGVPVSRVTISDEPFADSGLEWVWSPPWEQPYSGSSRSVDETTLTGKVLAGYQGWFNTPNDAADDGYVHWGVPGDWSIEQWPDPNDYDSSELFPVPGVTTARGEQAYLFSSANDSVVDRHFQWMREHDIDGVFVQRFGESFMFKDGAGNYSGEPQWPVVNARDAAHRSGRTWAIEYDIQKAGTEAERWQTIQEVKDDWEYLTDPARMNMLNDSHYQREDGKPVVAIFGLYVGAGNSYSTAQQQDLISYFQSRGIYVIGAGRHAQAASQIANAGLHDAYIPWQGYWAGGNSYTPHEAALDGVTEHIPHVFPGFSWTHLQNSSTATSRDREDGDFYWRMLNDAVNETDAPWLFIGMFDEYDEGTNLIPATDDPPVPDTDNQGNPLTYQVSDPRPNDWWMRLTGAAKQALQGKASIDNTTPTETSLQNRSNVGGEARWEPGQQDRLSSVETADSTTELVDVPVQGTVSTAIRSSGPYLYFSVDDGFLSSEVDGRDVTIEVEYLDLISGEFGLEYDAVGEAFTTAAIAPLTGSGLWRTHRFELTDAFFANRQSGGADFRFTTPGLGFLVRRVSVVKESVLIAESDLGIVNDDLGLRQVELSGDGQTVVTTVGGRSARAVTGGPGSLYMYFDIDSRFSDEVHAGLNAIVEVVYRDIGGGQLNIQYDSTGPAYMNAGAVSVGNTGEWRTARFYLDDAFFAGRQNGNSDFRLTGSNAPIDRVRVLQSFGDLIEPELVIAPPVVDTPSNTVSVSLVWSDDWRSGESDAWAPQEGNRVTAELSNDGGQTWQATGTLFEGNGGLSASTYDTDSGTHGWVDEFVLDTADLSSGSYQLRVTPIDGRDNKGEPVETDPFVVFAPPELAGDYNVDGIVNAADYSIWRDARGTAVTPYNAADGNGDGFVDEGDDAVWRTNYGRTLPLPASAFITSDRSHDVSSARLLTLDEILAEAATTDDSLLSSISGVATIDEAFAFFVRSPVYTTDADASRLTPASRRVAGTTSPLLLLHSPSKVARTSLSIVTTDDTATSGSLRDEVMEPPPFEGGSDSIGSPWGGIPDVL